MKTIPVGRVAAPNGASRVGYQDQAKKERKMRWVQKKQGSDIREQRRNGRENEAKSVYSAAKMIEKACREQLTKAIDYSKILGACPIVEVFSVGRHLRSHVY